MGVSRNSQPSNRPRGTSVGNRQHDLSSGKASLIIPDIVSRHNDILHCVGGRIELNGGVADDILGRVAYRVSDNKDVLESGSCPAVEDKDASSTSLVDVVVDNPDTVPHRPNALGAGSACVRTGRVHYPDIGRQSAGRVHPEAL